MLSPTLASGYALLVLLVLSFTRAETTYESIYTLDAFAAQPTCVQNCFTIGYSNINCNTDVLGSRLGCPNTPCATAFAAADSCYCRGDLQTAAHELLAFCIDQVCSVGDNSVNLATAVGIYSTYCEGRGFTALPMSTTTMANSQPTGSVVASTISGVQSDLTSTSSSSSSTVHPSTTPSPAASSENKTLIIALACVGLLAIMAIFVAAIFYWKFKGPKPPQPPRPLDPSQTKFTGTLEPSQHESVSQMGRSDVATWVEDTLISTNIGGNRRSVAGQRWNYLRR
jgi:hypothetical protein